MTWLVGNFRLLCARRSRSPSVDDTGPAPKKQGISSDRATIARRLCDGSGALLVTGSPHRGRRTARLSERRTSTDRSLDARSTIYDGRRDGDPDDPSRRPAARPARGAPRAAGADSGGARGCARRGRRSSTSASPSRSPTRISCASTRRRTSRRSRRPAARAAGSTPTPTLARRAAGPAALAAGGAVALARAALAGEIEAGISCVRPPGHHAMRDPADGLLPAQQRRASRRGARGGRRGARGDRRLGRAPRQRHAGHLLATTRPCSYMSVHQLPFYPGTGAPSGSAATGAGRGRHVNVRCPPGSGDRRPTCARSTTCCCPRCARFAPELVLVSAGFDAHRARSARPAAPRERDATGR